MATSARYCGVPRTGLPSRLIALVAVFAFALQAYIAETHIHSGSLDFDGSVKTSLPKSSEAGKTSPKDDGQDCPFCKAVAQSSFFVAPPTGVQPLPAASIKTVAFVYIEQVAFDPVAHAWLSRAPPRV